mmetsp:Transcript_121378/g.234156  ORF Transcript_121378/g.234156 Transcript_121378/m.234156 type:complete len:100 (+) Transcript_121378:110-409(+)
MFVRINTRRMLEDEVAEEDEDDDARSPDDVARSPTLVLLGFISFVRWHCHASRCSLPTCGPVLNICHYFHMGVNFDFNRCNWRKILPATCHRAKTGLKL